jgi:hypothetical protein
MVVAVPLELLASPLKSGRDLGGGDRSALVIGGTEKIRTGGAVVFCKVVAVSEAQVKRDGQVRAKGSPVHHATLGPLEEKACPGAVTIGKRRPLKAGSLDGTLLRVPDTPANRAFFGTVGTGDDSGPYPCLRALPLTCCSCRALFAMPHGPAGTDKAAAEQSLLDEAMERFPVLFTPGWIWLMDRNYHGAPRIARMIRSAHVLIRLKSDIPLKRTSEILPDGSYRAELSGGGVTVPVRVIEYFTDVEGQQVPEMFCLVTDLMDWEDHPARELAARCKWRWDGSETALREAKAPLRGAGPDTGPMLRSGSPDLVRQELAAWAAAVGLTRGVARDAALAAAPARKGRRAGLPVRTRDLSFTRAVRAALSAIRLGNSCYQM